jgi:hypothetical protein
MNRLSDEQIDWLNRVVKGGAWKLNSKGKVDVKGNVDCSGQEIKSYPVEFGTVYGYFMVEDCEYLTSLKGSPSRVTGFFSCDGCVRLNSLEGAPDSTRKFYCRDCAIETLKGAPSEVDGDFTCEDCGYLKSLEGAPETLKGMLITSNCPLPAAIKTIIDEYNKGDISWEEVYKLIHRPNLIKGKELGLF